MKLRALLLAACLGLTAIAPLAAKTKTPKSSNANVKQATRKAPKYKPMKYKAPKLSKKKPKAAKYGVSHLPSKQS
jgi:hypothetical protein